MSDPRLQQLVNGLAAAHRKVLAAIEGISGEDLDRLGHRGENNPINVAGVIEYLTGHIAEHAGQITQAGRLIAQRERGEAADAGQS